LCGSDKRLFYNGTANIPGHEISGEIARSGPGAELPVGTRVNLYIPLFCGSCEECRAQSSQRCGHIKGLIGWQTPGGFAEYLVVPAANAMVLPDDIALDEGVLLLDTIGTSAHAVRQGLEGRGWGAVPPRAAVIGCGPLGLGTLLVLKTMGCPEIYAADVAADRLAQAEAFGAKPLTDLEAAENQFPLVVEASGHATARQTALSVVRTGGAVLLLGESDTPWVINPSPKLRRKECFYIRSFYFPQHEIPANFELLRRGRREFRQLISKTGPLEDLQALYAEFCAGKTLKPMVEFGS